MSLKISDIQFSYNRTPINQKKKSIEPEIPILSIEELTIEKGEHVFLHGPSGSGKTTLLGLIAGVLVPDRGSIRIMDQEITQFTSYERDAFRGTHIGYIFQQFNLIPYLTVEQNIELPCRLHPERRSRLNRSLKQSVQEMASRLQIEELLKREVHHLSVGQSQRVAAARALIGNPGLLIADEPTSALDTDRREAFLELLFENCRASGATLVFVSHDMGLAKRFHRSIELREINSMHHPAT